MVRLASELFYVTCGCSNAASMHFAKRYCKGYAPDKDTLDAVLSAAESLLYREFILPDRAARIKKETPGRSKSIP
jgi:hypothetical protein